MHAIDEKVPGIDLVIALAKAVGHPLNQEKDGLVASVRDRDGLSRLLCNENVELFRHDGNQLWWGWKNRREE